VSAGGELDAAGITDPEMRAAYLRCRVLTHSTPDLLPGDPAAHPGPAPPVHGCTGRPTGRRGSGRLGDGTATGNGGGPAGERQPATGALERQLAEAWPPGTATTRDRRSGGHRAPLRDRPQLLPDLPGVHAMTSSSHDYPTMATWPATCAGRRRSSACRCCRCWAPEGPGPRRSRPRCAGHGLQLTNFLRDVGEDLDRGGCTCPPTCCPRTVWPGVADLVPVRGHHAPQDPAALADLVGTPARCTGPRPPGSRCSHRARGLRAHRLRLYRGILDSSSSATTT